MKLNYDCVRDVLLTMEEITGLKDDLSFEPIGLLDIVSELKDYSKKEIYYTVLKLNEAGYIRSGWATEHHNNNYLYYMVDDITFKGHEYLNSIRNKKVWNAIKKGAIGLTMSIIPKLAETYILNQTDFLK